MQHFRKLCCEIRVVYALLPAMQVDLYLDQKQVPPGCVPGAWLTVVGAKPHVASSTGRLYTKWVGSTRALTCAPQEMCPHGCSSALDECPPCWFPCTQAVLSRAVSGRRPAGPSPNCHLLAELTTISGAGRPRRTAVHVNARVRTLQHLELRLLRQGCCHDGHGANKPKCPNPTNFLDLSAWLLLDDGSAVAEAWIEGAAAWEVLGLQGMQRRVRAQLPDLLTARQKGLDHLRRCTERFGARR